MIARRTTAHRATLTACWLVVLVEAIVTLTSLWVAAGARGRVVDADDLPAETPRTMIVLGAKVRDGQVGTYIGARLDVAVDAYRAGRVDRILNSGNDADDAGNEVRVMRAYLEAHGVPSTAIVDDPLGLNTNATCRRAATLYDVRSAMIVTQNFHIARAVTLCRAWGIDTLGVVAPCDQCSIPSLARNQLREALASRPRAFVDSLRARRSRPAGQRQ